ncbi:cytochrome d ubiquinol oxidase subunit II [Polluticoccus soli]|uniref:cytochrome d ubiquinol oxidase subunit II n=1 Tax=Polluticoccus soli TaxID=3034150 RepID=UPI0023E1B8D3|nr:cytochrome d ubiquinol oxidase subunit II [Flavipsychrobacter sp. JY13-12]
MKRTGLLITFLLLLSTLSGYLFSKVSWVGKVGIRWFYKEYGFLKIWWQAALVVFAILLGLYLLHFFLQKKLSGKAKLYHIAGILVAIVGVYFTYDDFRHTLSHRWLGERFHLGAYCFWFGWISICVFFLTTSTTISSSKDGAGR